MRKRFWDDYQLGFRHGGGTGEVLAVVNILLQKCWDQRCDVFICFLEHKKVLNRARHDKLIEIIIIKRINDYD